MRRVCLLTFNQGSAILSGIQSLTENWQPGFVCVVAVVCPLDMKQRTVLLDERKGFFVFFINKRFPCPLLASLGNWKEGGARLPQDLERLEERV